MKLFILLLTIAALLQSTLIPLNLCLILLIARSFVVEEKSNYYLGFIFGILLGVLIGENLGFYPLIFLISVKLISIVRRSSLAAHFLIILPTAFLVIFITYYLEKFVLNQSYNLASIILQALLSLPLYLVLKIWEERFIVRADTKLKI